MVWKDRPEMTNRPCYFQVHRVMAVTSLHVRVGLWLSSAGQPAAPSSSLGIVIFVAGGCNYDEMEPLIIVSFSHRHRSVALKVTFVKSGARVPGRNTGRPSGLAVPPTAMLIVVVLLLVHHVVARLWHRGVGRTGIQRKSLMRRT